MPDNAQSKQDRYAYALRNSLQKFIDESLHISVNQWAELAGISEGTIRNFLKGRTHSLAYTTLTALAEAVHVSVYQLAGEKNFTDIKDVEKYIEGALEVKYRIFATATWGEGGELISEQDRTIVKLPEDPRYMGVPRFGAVILDKSANKLFPQDTILICASYRDIGRGPRDNEMVLCALEETHKVGTAKQAERGELREVRYTNFFVAKYKKPQDGNEDEARISFETTLTDSFFEGVQLGAYVGINEQGDIAYETKRHQKLFYGGGILEINALVIGSYRIE